jgi:hypothetical protein
MADFIRRLYIPVFTPSDGDCFYYSISLALTGSTILTPAIRFAVVAKIIEAEDELKNTALKTLSEDKRRKSTNRFSYTCKLHDSAFSAGLMSKLRFGRSDISYFPGELFFKADLHQDVVDTFHYACAFHMFIVSMVLNRPFMNYGLNDDRAQKILWSIRCINSPPVSMCPVSGNHFVSLLPENEDTKNNAEYSPLVSFLNTSEIALFNARPPEERTARERQPLYYACETTSQ